MFKNKKSRKTMNDERIAEANFSPFIQTNIQPNSEPSGYPTPEKGSHTPPSTNLIISPRQFGDYERQRAASTDYWNNNLSTRPDYAQQSAPVPLSYGQYPANRFLYSNDPIGVMEANQLLPRAVAKEIISEKLRSLAVLLIGLFGGLASTFFIALHYLIGNAPRIIGISRDVIPNVELMIGVLIVTTGLFLWGVLNMRQIVLESNTYIASRRQGYDTLPQFILTNFKRMLRRTVIMNWLCIPSYVILAVVFGILMFLNSFQGQTFRIGFWNLGVVPLLDSEIITVSIITGCILFLHVINGVLIKKRKSNIISYFGSQVMNNEQVHDIAKRTNRICFAFFMLFLVILFFAISIPLLLIRKHSDKSFSWPWKSR